MLVTLFNVPRDDNEWNTFAWTNFTAVRKINAAVLAQKKTVLTEYQLCPINFGDLPGFLDRNQQAHNAFNGVLGLPSNDLRTADFRDEGQLKSWIWLNAREVEAAQRALKI